MKKLGWLVVAVLALALGAGLVFAQETVNRVTANVPFAFYVGKTEMPAGHYEVYRPGDTALEVVIRNTDTGKSAFAPIFLPVGSDEVGKAELVFKKIDGKSYLWEVVPRWAEGWELAGLHVKHAPSTASETRTTVVGE